MDPNNFNNAILQKLDDDLRNNNYPPAILCRVIFLNFLRFCFYIRKPGELKYDLDENLTEIRIDDSWTTNEDDTQNRPSITVSRTQLGALNTTLSNNMARYHIPTESYQHIDLLSTNMVFNCYSSNMMESEFMASIVFSMIRQLREEIRMRGIHQILSPIILTPEAARGFPSDTKIEKTNTAVSCQIFMVDRWAKRPLTAKELSDIESSTGWDGVGYNKPPNTLGDVIINPET